MDEIGAEILDEFGEDVLYASSPDSAPVSVRAVIRDRGAKARIGRGLVLTSDAVAAVSDAMTFARNGILTIQGTRYRIDGRQVGAPGLTELGLTRMDGDRVEEQDGLSEDIIDEFGRTIVLNGLPVRAHIVRTGVEQEIRKGVLVETVRTIATVRVGDAIGVRPKDPVSIGGRVYSVRSTDRSGFGLISLTLD